MVEIKKSFFEETDETNPIIVDILEDEKACRRVAALYGDFVYHYAKRKFFFYSSRLKQKLKDKRQEQLKRFIRITAKLGVSHDVYMKIQFEQMLPFLRKRGLNYVPFANLISQNAVNRFNEGIKRVKESHDSETGRKEIYSTKFLDIEESIKNSIKICSDRFAKILEFQDFTRLLSIEQVLKELEMLVRAGIVSNIYVYSLFTDNRTCSEFLKNICSDTEKKLNSYEKDMVKKLRKEALKEVNDERILKYV